MAYNVSKCKFLHTRSNNNSTNYSVGAAEISEVNEEKDLRVTIISELKLSKHFWKSLKPLTNHSKLYISVHSNISFLWFLLSRFLFRSFSSLLTLNNWRHKNYMKPKERFPQEFCPHPSHYEPFSNFFTSIYFSLPSFLTPPWISCKSYSPFTRSVAPSHSATQHTGLGWCVTKIGISFLPRCLPRPELQCLAL